MLAPLEVQAAPVAAAPFEQEQEFEVQIRFVVLVQAVVSYVFPVQVEAHELQARLVVPEQAVVSYVPPPQFDLQTEQ